MPKKTRRMKERAAQRRAAIGPAPESVAEPANPSRSTLAPSPRSTYATPTFDYSHIYKDLRRIAFFALVFFGVLIALSFWIK